ncbi:uncharacterized protein L201_006111 [Kwoniella dendrophila CBS 6074]|uniref:Uncharacterized protein n=1 Tax=Kwoniella dendrophila CBS 6074 TaxID=1295534 RepID=A0AAX4K2X3_9TREE
MVRREKYFFKDGKSKYRYTFEHLYPEYIPQSPIYGPIPLHLKKLQGVPKPWRLISKLHLRIEATGNSQQMQDMIKSSTVKKLTSTETEVAAMSWCTPISSLVGAEALEMVLEKGGKLPKTIHIRHYDENLPELLNTISSQLTDIAIAFNRANSSLDNMIRKMKWDRFRSLKRFRINCNRKDEEASSEDIDFSPDVNINALPLPKLVDLEIGVYYSSCNPIRLRTAEGMNVEIEWIRNIARTFKQIVPYYGRRKQPDRVFYPLFQRYSMYDSYPQYVEHHDQLSKAFESEVYL